VSDVVAIGDFMAWEGGCVMIGKSFAPIPMHAHYAIQVAFGPRRGIRFRTDERDPWTEYDAVIIPSRNPHAMDSTGIDHGAVLLIEPETPQGRALAERCGDGGILGVPLSAFDGMHTALLSTWKAGKGPQAVVAAAQDVIRTLTAGVSPMTASDDRILRAIEYIRENLDKPLTLNEVAKEAFLSPSRFRHLFVEQTGTALRPYLLWRRFLRAWEVVMQGESLSSAAHQAGFADAAHLTRTSRRMFGFAPSALRVNVRPASADIATA
jgi:AraC family transcriptional regulator